MKGKILSINISTKKGIPKSPVKECNLKEDWGLAGDIHSGPGERQVSLLAWESIRKFSEKKLKCPKIKFEQEELKPGDFAENITTRKMRLSVLPIGTRLRMGDKAMIEITKIGKGCHRRCSIYRRMGDCIMPKEGVFARVIKGGPVMVSDEIEVLK
ncbi:MOSC domain-containing protein [bacterium]|nr:MOSC domain-containing protein [bacterium]MCK4326552.1 MOSC domain-containing protein [bacterium]MCK4436557.1 MOSC domain-containing protein [bacterium]